jgi:GNAT superfamily N-acetyltransferase
MSLIRVTTPDQLAAFCHLPCAPRLDPDTPAMRQADSHWLALDGRGQPAARASLWWTHAPPYAGQRIGCIGHYAAAGRDAAAALLAHARTTLAAAGCTLAVGPLDGNTFRAYRFVTRRSFEGTPHPRFFLEPDNPDAWPADFTTAGFVPWADYYSAIAALDQLDPRLSEISGRLAQLGIVTRPLDPARFMTDLAQLYDLVMASFARALLFAPISREEFMAQYAPLQGVLTPELVLLAAQADRLVGFMLALPDLAQAQRGEAVDTVILKTVAVLPKIEGSGLGSALTVLVHEAARQLGFRRAIHALMHAGNRSRRISAHYARPMRQYTLFAQSLA